MKNPKEILTRSLTVVAVAAALHFPATQFSAASPGPNRAPQAKSDSADVQHDIYGTVREVKGSTLTIETRAKKTVQVDTKAASEAQRAVVLVVGHAVLVHGSYDTKGVLHASSVQRAKASPSLWPEDK
ncbi:MAG TPA: hypothetical protein VFP96_18285 [Candidatus Acidoferrum sp.]|jgi:hypothetical protein|nr:hypothetical protein [Candidatus Acidoferrum sp.]